MRFTAGFIIGGAVCAVLMGKPSPSSLFGQFIRWVETEDEHTPTLHYFNVRGRGEAIRVAFADKGLPLQEHTFSSEAWGKNRTDGLKAKL